MTEHEFCLPTKRNGCPLARDPRPDETGAPICLIRAASGYRCHALHNFDIEKAQWMLPKSAFTSLLRPEIKQTVWFLFLLLLLIEPLFFVLL